MKCLQCGTELDRLSKWRGSSDYCSEECKKASQDEFNRLAMSRLMQPRPARPSARAASSGSRSVESSTGSVTVVTHPVGASAPAVSEPPFAAFIIDVFAALSGAQPTAQSPLELRPGVPLIPDPELPMADSLLALESMLRGIRPGVRGARTLPPLGRQMFAPSVPEKIAISLPEPPLEWPASLATLFYIVGLDSVPFASPVPSSPAGPPTALSGQTVPAGTSASTPVAHRTIPVRRPLRDLPALTAFAAGSDYLIQSPAPSAPRLRIHLPKPVLQPYRPRYAFAPRESAVVEPVNTPPVAPVDKAAEPLVAVKPVSPVEGKTSPKPAPRSESKQQSKAARKMEAKSESPRGEARNQAKAEPSAPAPIPTPAPAAPALEPASSTPAKVEPVQPEKTLELVPKPEPRKPQAPAAPVVPATFAAPSFGGKADVEPESDGFFSRMPGWQKAAAAVVLLGVAIGAWAVPAYNRSAKPAKTPSIAQAGATMGADSWETDSSGDTAGIARRRVISLYKPGRTKRNYVFEFTGHVEQRAMGWVFRMKDPRNYYCLKLEHTGNGASSAVQLVKFAVVNGEEQPHRLVSIAEPLVAGQPVRIRLDVRGQNFSTQVNGRPVDVWIDNQIAEGTVGFSNESGERAVIRTVKVSY
jgi:hypothetical protein